MLIGNEFKQLTNDKDLGHFVNSYDVTPDQFMNDGTPEETINLENKIVVALECDIDNKPINVLGIYIPRPSHMSKLIYSGHIAFIDIRRKDNDTRIELLCKDDECYPEKFNEWYEHSPENHCLHEEYDYFNKEYCLKLINTIIQGAMLDLSIEYKAEDIIILEGL